MYGFTGLTLTNRSAVGHGGKPLDPTQFQVTLVDSHLGGELADSVLNNRILFPSRRPRSFSDSRRYISFPSRGSKAAGLRIYLLLEAAIANRLPSWIRIERKLRNLLAYKHEAAYDGFFARSLWVLILS